MERGKIVDELIKVEGLPENVSDNGWEQLLDTVESLCQDEQIMTEAFLNANYPNKKAKEIALDAALKLWAPNTQMCDNLLVDAGKIYNWLIKDEAQVPKQNLNLNK